MNSVQFRIHKRCGGGKSQQSAQSSTSNQKPSSQKPRTVHGGVTLTKTSSNATRNNLQRDGTKGLEIQLRPHHSNTNISPPLTYTMSNSVECCRPREHSIAPYTFNSHNTSTKPCAHTPSDALAAHPLSQQHTPVPLGWASSNQSINPALAHKPAHASAMGVNRLLARSFDRSITRLVNPRSPTVIAPATRSPAKNQSNHLLQSEKILGLIRLATYPEHRHPIAARALHLNPRSTKIHPLKLPRRSPSRQLHGTQSIDALQR